MITETFLKVVLFPIRFILSAIPSISWPTWFQRSGPGSVVAQTTLWGQSVGKIGGWFPVGTMFDAIDIMWVAVLAAVAIKTVRILVSLFTAGGGSAM